MLDKAIGGFFELELNEKKHYHSLENVQYFNSGRNALEFILKERKILKLYIPYFTCDAILKPINKLGLSYEFYSINEDLEPIFDFNLLGPNDFIICNNYFGLKDNYISGLNKENIILDNAQAFYYRPNAGQLSFNSPRKFFGVPDGAFVFGRLSVADNMALDQSSDRMGHLMERIELSPEQAYATYAHNERKFDSLEIKKMSLLTQHLLKSIDYEKVRIARSENFNYLHHKLGKSNELKLEPLDKNVPLTYPYKIDPVYLREKLKENRIYCPLFWPNVLNWTPKDTFEYSLAKDTIHLPIDQRYGKEEMDFILKFII